MLSNSELKEIIEDIKLLNKEGYQIANYKTMIINDGITRDGRIVNGVRLTIDFMNEKEEWESSEISNDSKIIFQPQIQRE